MQNAKTKFSRFFDNVVSYSLVLHNLHSRRFKYILQFLTCIYALDLFDITVSPKKL